MYPTVYPNVYSTVYPYYPNYPYAYSVETRDSGPSYKSLQDALAGIRQSVQGEREDELFYDYLISVAPTQEDQTIISSIRDDERKHNRMFRLMYKELTGQNIPPAAQEPEFVKPESFTAGVKKALFGELSAVERYRDIRAGLPTRYYRDMMFEIITDELKHAQKYNYILVEDLYRNVMK